MLTSPVSKAFAGIVAWSVKTARPARPPSPARRPMASSASRILPDIGSTPLKRFASPFSLTNLVTLQEYRPPAARLKGEAVEILVPLLGYEPPSGRQAQRFRFVSAR